MRLNDFDHHSLQESKTLEAIQNPDCGWFYRADASTFHDIPGSPIAYWASEAMHEAFKSSTPLADVAKPRVGLQTGNNNLYLRYWHECSLNNTLFSCPNAKASVESAAKWYPHNKGGSFRRWAGNAEYLVNYEHNGAALSEDPGASTIPDGISFLPALTYSRISSGVISFRLQENSMLYDSAAVNLYPPREHYESLLALLNSSVLTSATTFLVPTLNAQPGDIAKLPINKLALSDENVKNLSRCCIEISGTDWDSQETSWDFKRNPLV